MTKYHNVKQEQDNIVFDSKLERDRYLELKAKFNAGQISEPLVHVPFSIIVNGYLICKYYADFVYYEKETGKRIVEDCKGYRTHEYGIKKKLMKAALDIDIVEITNEYRIPSGALKRKAA